MKRLFVLIAIVWCSFVFVPSISAVSVSTSNLPSSVDKDQEFDVDVSLSCSGCTSDSYVRAVFYPSGTSYFGFTQNKDGSWINAPGGSCTQYYKIAPSDLTEGSWSGKLKVKPDASSSYYIGPGEYLFKIGRYTSSCSSPTWSGEITMAITGPSPSPSPTPAPTSTPTPTALPVTSTGTPTKTPTPTKKNTPTPTFGSDTQSSSSSDTDFDGMVLGQTIDPSPPPESTPSGGQLRVFAVASALVGLGLALIAGVLVWQKRNALTTTKPQ